MDRHDEDLTKLVRKETARRDARLEAEVRALEREVQEGKDILAGRKMKSPSPRGGSRRRPGKALHPEAVRVRPAAPKRQGHRPWGGGQEILNPGKGGR
jgi:hypothetical protein